MKDYASFKGILKSVMWLKQNDIYEEVVSFEASRITKQDLFHKETLHIELKNLNFILTTLGSLRFEVTTLGFGVRCKHEEEKLTNK